MRHPLKCTVKQDLINAPLINIPTVKLNYRKNYGNFLASSITHITNLFILNKEISKSLLKQCVL